MKLIKLSLTKKKDVYVNPDNVTTVIPYTEEKTMIHFVDSSSTIVVVHDIEYVISKLNAESNLGL